MSFSFGSKPAFGASTPFGAAQPNLSFGAPTSQAPGQTSLFGTPTVQPGGGLSFGAPAASTPGTGLFSGNTSFGTPQANLSFGAPTASAAPTFGAPAVGAAPSFGAPTAAAAPSFGAPTASAAPSFGAATATPSFGAAPAPSFGLPTASAAPSFGAPAASVAPTFGATPAPAFGAATTSAATGFSFGGTPAPNLSFGGAPAPNLSFGAQPVTSKPALNFGAPAATTAATGLSFGAPSTGFSLGGTTPGFGATTSAAATSLSFGAPSFGLGTTTTASSGGLFAGFGTTPSTSITLGTTTAAPAPVGLGGVASSTPTSTTLVTKTEQAPKEQNLPNEIQQTVDSFRSFVKQQKTYSSDVARCSIKEFRKVESDIDAVNSLLNELEKQLASNKNIAEKLKYDTARGLQQVEMAQRTYDTPLGLQYENTAPLNFFLELADSFERELQNMKLQIENTDKYVRNIGKPAPLSSQDLAVGMRRIHETFVALAGRLQSVHSQVEAQKEQYLNFRKHMLNDSANVFESDDKDSEIINLAMHSIRIELPKIATGPTPFNSLSHPSVVQAVAQNTPPPAYGANNTFGGFSSNLGGSSNMLLFGSPAAQSGFQLQKPPTGNKRGKP